MKPQLRSTKTYLGHFKRRSSARLGLLAALLMTAPLTSPRAQEPQKKQGRLPHAKDDVFTLFSGRSKLLYEGEDTKKHFVFSINTKSSTRPQSPVKVKVFVSDPNQAAIGRVQDRCEGEAIELCFEEWGRAQEFYVSGLDDIEVDGDQPVQVRFGKTRSDDPNFDGIELDPVDLVNVDNEVTASTYEDPLIEVVTDRRSVAEGSDKRLHVTIRMKKCPAWFGGWITPTLSDTSQARIVGESRLERITPHDWTREIKLEIEAINDQEADGDQEVRLMFPGVISHWAGPTFGCGFGTSIHWHIPQPLSFMVYDNEKPNEPPPKATILKHGWDVPNMYLMSQGIEEIAQSPYDGIFFFGNEATKVFQDQPIPLEKMKQVLEPMTWLDFGTTQQNYLAVLIDSIEGGFAGEGMKNIVENFRKLGQAVGELGLADRPMEGIAFDHEVYDQSRNPWDWPTACPGLERDECAKAAFDTGKAMMSALMEGWPTVHFMPLYGFWLYDPATYRQLDPYAPHPDALEQEDMYGYFAAGVFVATVDSPAQYVDGGELYYLRTDRQFARTVDFLKNDMPERNPFLPDAYRQAYKDQAKQAFGIFDDRERHFGRAAEVTPTIWEFLVDTAKRRADVIWLYTQRHDWWPSDGNDWPALGPVGSIEGMEGYVDDRWYQANLRAIQAK